MKGLIAEITALGYSVGYFSRRANLSFRTVKRIDCGELVHARNLAKANNTLSVLRLEFKPTQSANKVVQLA